MQLKIEKGTFKDYSLKDISDALETNLFSLDETTKTIKDVNPDLIINAAAKVGGILANNTFRTEFILENLKININILEALINFPSIKLINLGSSCIYPLNASIPTAEESLMNGKLEPTNSPYAMAKIAAIEMGNALKSQYGHKIINLMPTNLYGPNDNFDLTTSHVLAALINKITYAKKHKKKSVEIWGTGKPKRDFLHVNDLADAVCFLAEKYSASEPINVGSSREISIKELAETIAKLVGWNGTFSFNQSMPDGTILKKLDTTKINDLGWHPKIDIKTGIKQTIKEYEKSL